jgi:ribosome recycling factor
MRFETQVEGFRDDLATIRTGRASAALVEELEVEVYNTKMLLKELAAITIPEARQIMITPWDKSNLEAVEKALQKAGFNPIVEGAIIRLKLPPLTGEDRERLQREVGEKAEEARTRVRRHRRELIDEVERLEEEKQISEDESFTRKKEIDDEVKEANQQVEDLAEEKKRQLAL